MTRRIKQVLTLSAAALMALGCARASETGTASAPRNQLVLFDGRSLDGWEQVGPGRFVLQPDGSIASEGGMGLFYYARQPFRDFVLELEYRTESPAANSGIFVRFPDPPQDPWDAVHRGYEIQIDDAAEPIHMTGSIYSFKAPYRLVSRPVGEWNQYRIEVVGQRYQIWLNGEKVNDFIGVRGREGYIGLQNHDDDSRVHFRNIRVRPLQVANPPEHIGDLFAVAEPREPIRVLVMTATHGFRHGPAIEATREVLADVARTTEFEFEFTEAIDAFSPENLTNFDVLFFANSTLRTVEEAPAQAARDEGAEAFALTLTTPQGDMPGRLLLRGTAETPRGTIQLGQFPAIALEELRREAGQTAFAFDGGEYGRIRGAAHIEGESIQGTLTVGGSEMPFAGRRAEADGTAAERVADAHQQAILGFARGGGGVAVSHAGLDAFYRWDDYRELVGGGLFQSHPWTQPVRISVEEPANPAVRHFGDGFWLRDEIYVLDRNPRTGSRVLLSLDMGSVQQDPALAAASRHDHPLSWLRRYGDGRVFVTALGHFADVWQDPGFLEHVLQGLRIAAGRVPADFGG
jgi:type 1 glutamine amidotransferase